MFAFNNKEVRDLAWAIGSPPLMVKGKHFFDDDFFISEYKLFLPHLKQLDTNPAPLLEYLETQRSSKLGFYFEHLLRYWLNKCENYELITSNLPIYRGKQTLGEIDFIVKDKNTAVFEHWEVAVKFYLGYGNTLKWSAWIGPNPTDTLARKMQKLRTKQLSISTLPEAKELLEQRGVNNVIPKIFIKGFFFYHLKKGMPYQQFPFNTFIGHNKGWWLYYNEFVTIADTKSKWYIFDKTEWLSAKIIQDERELLTYNEMIQKLTHRIKNSKQPQMISKISNNMELSRGFVVPEWWPGIE